MTPDNQAALAQKISRDAARFLSDYITGKVNRLTKKNVYAGFTYMAILGGVVSVITSILEAIETQNPDLAHTLREDIAAKVRKIQ